MPMNYGLGAYGGSPSYPDPGDDYSVDCRSPEEIKRNPFGIEPKQTVWYWICRIVGTIGLWVGLPLLLIGGLIAETSTPNSPSWERTLYIKGGIVLITGLVLRFIGFIIKKE